MVSTYLHIVSYLTDLNILYAKLSSVERHKLLVRQCITTNLICDVKDIAMFISIHIRQCRQNKITLHSTVYNLVILYTQSKVGYEDPPIKPYT